MLYPTRHSARPKKCEKCSRLAYSTLCNKCKIISGILFILLQVHQELCTSQCSTTCTHWEECTLPMDFSKSWCINLPETCSFKPSCGWIPRFLIGIHPFGPPTIKTSVLLSERYIIFATTSKSSPLLLSQTITNSFGSQKNTHRKGQNYCACWALELDPFEQTVFTIMAAATSMQMHYYVVLLTPDLQSGAPPALLLPVQTLTEALKSCKFILSCQFCTSPQLLQYWSRATQLWYTATAPIPLSPVPCSMVSVFDCSPMWPSHG